LQASSSEPLNGPGWPLAGRRPLLLDLFGEILGRSARAHASSGPVMTDWPSSRRSGRPEFGARSRSVPGGTDAMIDPGAWRCPSGRGDDLPPHRTPGRERIVAGTLDLCAQAGLRRAIGRLGRHGR
jgi:hypothetical protein